MTIHYSFTAELGRQRREQIAKDFATTRRHRRSPKSSFLRRSTSAGSSNAASRRAPATA